MNGEALTKRYEVRDAETGEVVEGPVFVLDPRKDSWVMSCLFAYLRLCGIEGDLARAVLWPKRHDDFRPLREALRESMQTSTRSSYSRTDLIYDLDKDPSEVTLAEVNEIAAELGLAVSTIIYQITEKQAREQEERRVKEREKAAG